jgi:hypothetical protein
MNLTVDAFEIDDKTLADADWHHDNWTMDGAKQVIVQTVIKNLALDDKKRFEEYQKGNDPKGGE